MMERLIPYIPSSLLPHLPLIYRSSTSFSHWLRHSWSARLLLLFVISRMTYRWWPKKDIKEKWFLVTGAGGGIGRFICRALAKQGAHLALCDINADSLQTLAKHIHESYPQCHIEIFTCDISKKENIYEMAKNVQQRCNFIYGVINNAGIVSALPLLSTPDSRIEQTLNVNTMSSVWMTKAFLPEMIKRNEGHITFVASAAGLTGCPKMVDYCMSKFALVGFADALRAELKLQKSAVCTTIICPAYVQTPLFTGWKSGPLESPLTPEYVGYKIVDSIQRDKLMVCMPRMVYVAVALQAILPTAVQDQLKLICGLGNSMDEYRGRSGS